MGVTWKATVHSSHVLKSSWRITAVLLAPHPVLLRQIWRQPEKLYFGTLENHFLAAGMPRCPEHQEPSGFEHEGSQAKNSLLLHPQIEGCPTCPYVKTNFIHLLKCPIDPLRRSIGAGGLGGQVYSSECRVEDLFLRKISIKPGTWLYIWTQWYQQV